MVIFCDEKMNDECSVTTLGRYYPYWQVYRRIRNPRFDSYSQSILGVKNKISYCIESFCSRIEPLIMTDFAVCVVPSSDPNNTDSGIMLLAKELIKRKGLMDATGCLQRVVKVPKLSLGGDRSLSVHLNSIRCVNMELLVGRNVLLLDDICTTQNSLLAAYILIRQSSQAKHIQRFALGQTTR